MNIEALNIEEIADIITFKMQQQQKPITKKSVMKLLFFLNRVLLGYGYNVDFKLSAWDQGPVSYRLYDGKYKFMNKHRELSTVLNEDFNSIINKLDRSSWLSLQANIDYIIQEYGNKTADELEFLTHETKSYNEAIERGKKEKKKTSKIKIELLQIEGEEEIVRWQKKYQQEDI